MANNYFQQFTETPNVSQVIISGVININTSAAITSTVGRFFTATKTGTGAYTVRLRENFVADLGIQVSLYATGTKALWARVNTSSNITSASTPTFIIETVNATGAPTDNTASAIALSFQVNARNSSVA